MAIKNPFGVGDSGALASERKITCRCCLLPFIVVAGPRTPAVQPLCTHCANHDMNASIEDRLAAVEDHAQRAREFADRAHAQLRVGMAERDEARAERKRLGRALYEANQDRDYLRAQLGGAWSFHLDSPGGGCSCGAKPCNTRTEANRVAQRLDYYGERRLDIPRLL